MNKKTIRQHLEYLFNHTEYDDALFQVGKLFSAKCFTKNDIERCINYAETKNATDSVYICYAAALPTTPPFGRINEDDFYSSNFVWADIDDPHDPDTLKSLYSHCPPQLAIVTARKPHRRIQLVWRLKQPCDCPETLTEALRGVCDALGGDPKVAHPVRYMRLAGTINRPNEKKRLAGRTDELTELHILNEDSYDIEHIIAAYPQTTERHAVTQPVITQTGPLQLTEMVADGREKLMSDMTYAAIINLTKQLQRWPEPQEVFDDVWPVYSGKVTSRTGDLEKEGRGSRALQQKIRSKLRAFKAGRIGHIEHDSAGSVAAPAQQDPPQGMYYVAARDITFNADDSSLIKDTLGQQELSVIYGESNCGKTFFMTDLAIHVARGTPWRGKRVTQGGVMYAALEGSRGFSKRFLAYCKKHAIEPAFPFAMTPCALDFYSENTNINAFVDLVKKAQDDIGDPKLIVIDTLARALAGGDENSGQDMGRLVHYADIIRKETGAHLSFVHHSGKNKALGARGHSSLRAAVDTEIEISREEGSQTSLIRFVKQREVEMLEDMAFSLERVVIGTNNFAEEITSCVVIPADVEENRTGTPLTAKEKFVYEAIVSAVHDKGTLSYPYGTNGPSFKCITYINLADKLTAMGYDDMYNKDGEETAMKHTKSLRVSLRDKGKIGFTGGLIWMTNDDYQN